MSAERNVVIVTGASSGIGAETARAFARRGWTVVLAARREQRLEQVARDVQQAGGEAMVQATDVSNRNEVQALAAGAVERFGRIDVLVNNAGFGVFGRAHELDERDLRDVFETNLFGLWYGIAAVTPVMIEQGRGHIFNVSSVIGKRGTPYHGAYCATKFAVNGLTESARVELKPLGVRMTLICPTRTATEFFDRGTVAEAAGRANAKFVTPMPARPVAEAIVRTVGRNRAEIVFGAGGKVMNWVNALWPGLVDRGMELYRREIAKRLEGADAE